MITIMMIGRGVQVSKQHRDQQPAVAALLMNDFATDQVRTQPQPNPGNSKLHESFFNMVKHSTTSHFQKELEKNWNPNPTQPLDI